MPSKNSKRRAKKPSPKKAKRASSKRRQPIRKPAGLTEVGLRSYAGKLAADLKPGDCVLLEGPLGAGKSTFARFLIAALGGPEASAGSPTFSIAHEYATPRGEVIHVDLYRLEDEMELEAAGIESYFLERAAIVICEWASRFPQWVERVAPPTSPNSLRIQLEFVPGRPNLRKLLRF